MGQGFAGDKRVADRLDIIARHQVRAQPADSKHRFGQHGRTQVAAWSTRRHALVTVHTHNFLDQIFFDRKIEAPARRSCEPALRVALNAQSERSEDALDFIVGDIQIEESGEALAAQRNRRAQRQRIGADCFD